MKESQHDEFKSLIPESFPDSLKGDFSAELQWNSWQAYPKELKKEVSQSGLHEK
jgi:hypothetical protein